MNVFVAGASGAIGRPLVAELVRRGHTVTGMTRSDAGAKALADLGAAVARVSAFDAMRLEQALRESRAEVVIDELTALPEEPGRDGRRRGGRPEAAAGGRRQPASPPPVDCGVTAVHPAGQRLLPPARPRARGRVRGAGGGRQPPRGEPRPHLRRAGGAAAGRRRASRASPCGTGSSTGRAPGTTRTGRRPIRCGRGESRSSARARASGRGSTSTTRPSPPPTR